MGGGDGLLTGPLVKKNGIVLYVQKTLFSDVYSDPNYYRVTTLIKAIDPTAREKKILTKN